MSEDKQFRSSAPYFLVSDLHKSLDYYHTSLGFKQPKLWGDPPEFATPSHDGFIFKFKQVKEGEALSPNCEHHWDAYVWTNDADALYAEVTADGAIIEYEPCIQREYDRKGFAVRDSYVIAFGQHYEA